MKTSKYVSPFKVELVLFALTLCVSVAIDQGIMRMTAQTKMAQEIILLKTEFTSTYRVSHTAAFNGHRRYKGSGIPTWFLFNEMMLVLGDASSPPYILCSVSLLLPHTSSFVAPLF